MNNYLELGLDAFRASFDKHLAEVEPGAHIRSAGRPTKANPNGEDAVWWQANAPAFIQSWITWRQNNPNLHILNLDGTPGIELEVKATVDVDGKDVLLKGFIDRVFTDANTGDLLIVDLKTGRNAPAPLQLAFYRRAMKQTYGIDAGFGGYWMAREGTLSTIHDLSQYPDAVVDYWIAQTYRGITNGIFLPQVSSLCKGCGVQKHCYVFNRNTRFSPVDVNMTEAQEADHV